MKVNLDKNIFFRILVNSAPKYRMIRHILLWSTALFLMYRGFQYISITISRPNDRSEYVTLSTLFFGSLTVASYLITTWLTRHYILLQFRVSLFFVSLILVHLVITTLVRWHFLWFIDHLNLVRLPRMYTVYAEHITKLANWQVPFDSIIVGLFSFSLIYNYLLYAVGFKVFKDMFGLKLKQTMLEQENLQLELNFLKAQVNPHFLFNTLNNIYSFSFKSPDKVANTILKLADLMRYSLYETEAELVLLAKEIKFLDSYIQLQRIRHEKDVELSYIVNGSPNGIMIPPFILIVFVENAFKHGLQAITKAGWIRIDLTIQDQGLTFLVENNLPSHKKKEVGGIGLRNVKKRLDYFYPNSYRLQLDEQEDIFRVYLTIQLHEPVLSSYYC